MAPPKGVLPPGPLLVVYKLCCFNIKSMNNPLDIKPHLDRLLEKFDRSALEPDPLAATLGYTAFEDIEVSCLIAGLFAYGRADLIQRNVAGILSMMGASPALFCEKFRKSKVPGWVSAFSYRFHKGDDLGALIHAIGRARRDHGSLLKLFKAHDDPSAETILPGLTGMVCALREYAKRDTQAFNSLLSNPSGGGAVKRWNLFLRWMVRKDDIDPGPWNGHISTSRLIIPLDVHVGRITRRLGMLKRKSNDLKAALEVTRFLRALDPEDPVKYDFAICSYGKLGYCVSKINPALCDSCDLYLICQR